MTNTNDLREMIALVDCELMDVTVKRLNDHVETADTSRGWEAEAAKQMAFAIQHIADLRSALRASASRTDFDAGRVAGQRDMQERKCEFCFGTGRHQGRFEHNGALCANCGGAGTIASLPLNVESGIDQCAGDIDPGFDECPKCGATMDENCKFDHEGSTGDVPSDPSPDSASAVRAFVDAASWASGSALDDDTVFCEIYTPGYLPQKKGSFGVYVKDLRAVLAATKAEAAPGPMGGAK